MEKTGIKKSCETIPLTPLHYEHLHTNYLNAYLIKELKFSRYGLFEEQFRFLPTLPTGAVFIDICADSNGNQCCADRGKQILDHIL